MSNVFKGHVLISGGLLVGYCLAYPVILAKYFYDKPEIDFGVYGVLFVTAFYVFWKFLSQKVWFKSASVILLVLPLFWLKLEYALYSELNSPQFLTYILLILLAAGYASILRFEFIPNQPRWVKLIAVPVVAVGFTISILSKEHSLSQLFVLFVALGLTVFYWDQSKPKALSFLVLGLLMVVLTNLIAAPDFFDRQSKYHDKVVYSQTTDLQTIDITEWRGNYWFYADGINQFSSIDSWLFYEPFVYPALQVSTAKSKVLVIGGENGMLVKDLRKSGLNDLDLIPIDSDLIKMAQNETLFLKQNEGSLNIPGLNFRQGDVFNFLNGMHDSYDLIFVDVADPVDLERNQYFTQDFYQLIANALTKNGLFITQSGSPYFATEAFEVVQKTIASAGFDPITFHNQILTLGEWSWTMGSKSSTAFELKEQLSVSDFNNYQTQWLNQDAMQMMLSFGKPTRVTSDLRVNTILEPTLYQYYLSGNYTLK